MADTPTTSGTLTDLNTTQQQGVRYLGLIIQALKAAFIQFGGTVTTATGGAATLPANPVGFVTATLPNGTVVKIPYYS
jgi:hypothetical protein